jgi:hypothetical protein
MCSNTLFEAKWLLYTPPALTLKNCILPTQQAQQAVIMIQESYNTQTKQVDAPVYETF